MSTTNKYNEILNLFTVQCEFRTWMNKPFIAGEKAIASNSFALAAVNLEKTEKIGPLDGQIIENILSVIPAKQGPIKDFSIKSLTDILSAQPLVDEFEECEECDGDGLVEWSYLNYDKHFDCPKCGGTGSIKTGKKVIDNSKRLRIGNSAFSLNIINLIVKAAVILNLETIYLVHQTEAYTGSIFQVGDVEILCMPVQEDNDQHIVGEVSLSE